MTEQQQKLLDLVRAYYAQHGRGPTQEWLMEQLGLKSKSGVHHRCQALVEYGFLQRLDHGSGKYIPADAHQAAVALAPTSVLLAELQRREARGERQ